MVASVAAISPEAGATCVTHPEGRVEGFVLGERAVFVGVVARDMLVFKSRHGIFKVTGTYWPQLTISTPSSTRASLKPELKPGAVTPSLHAPFRGNLSSLYSGSGM